MVFGRGVRLTVQKCKFRFLYFFLLFPIMIFQIEALAAEFILFRLQRGKKPYFFSLPTDALVFLIC